MGTATIIHLLSILPFHLRLVPISCQPQAHLTSRLCFNVSEQYLQKSIRRRDNTNSAMSSPMKGAANTTSKSLELTAKEVMLLTAAFKYGTLEVLLI